MKRRTLLGSAAMTLGGASVIGTGAFTSVRAERSISVDVVGDSEAFLKLVPCPDNEGSSDLRSSDFIRTDDTISIDLTSKIANDRDDISGDGITAGSLWRFPNAFKIVNQGTQPVCVDIRLVDSDGNYPKIDVNDSGTIDVGSDTGVKRTYEDGDPAVVFYPGSNDAPGNLFSDVEGGIRLGVSENRSQCIGFNVRTFGFTDSGDDPFGDAKMEIVANTKAEGNCGTTSQPQPGLGITLFDITQNEDTGFNVDGQIKYYADSQDTVDVSLEILNQDGEDQSYADDKSKTFGSDSTLADFEFDVNGLDSGTYTAVVTAEIDDQDIASVSDSVTFGVGSASSVSVSDAELDEASRLEFDIESDSEVTVDGIRFESSSTDATRVLSGGSSSPEVQVDDQAAISINNSAPKNSLFFYNTLSDSFISNINNKDLPDESPEGFYPFGSGSGDGMTNNNRNTLAGAEQTIESSQKRTIKIGYFREDGQGNSDKNKVNLEDEDITLSLRFGDGSTKQIKFTDISSSS